MDKQALKKQLYELDTLICDILPRNNEASQMLMQAHKKITEIVMGLDDDAV